MQSLALTLLVTSAYMGLLFAVAWWGDRQAARRPERRLSANVYALALAVYCTSWTYYGAVGTAARSGWDYLPIYLGPAIVFFFLPGLVSRIAQVVRRESINSLADFLSARYGRSRSLAAAATVAALFGALPYISLQLRSIGMSLEALTGIDRMDNAQPASETVLLTALALAAFAILFGTRHADATQRNHGLMHVLALEAVLKIVALCAVALVSGLMLREQPAGAVAEALGRFRPSAEVSPDFLTLLVLSMAAILCLPRQFHVGFIERRNEADLKRARWLFPLYMLVTSAVVIPITLAGTLALPAGQTPDLYVLSLPQSLGQDVLAMFVFLGGFSAATGMVIVAAIAVSTMVTNDLVVPMLLRYGRLTGRSGAVGPVLLVLRRSVIVIILMLAWLYYRLAQGSGALAEIGQLAFAAAAQFAPALVGAVIWRGGHRNGALSGLVLGMLVWAYTLFVPAILGVERLHAIGLTGIADPYALFGVETGFSPLVHGSLWSIALNLAAFVLVSLISRPRLRDRVQAVVFTGEPAQGAVDARMPGRAGGMSIAGTRVGDLAALAGRFLAPEAVENAFRTFAEETGVSIAPEDSADWRLVQRTERLLASALGAPSARVVLASALADTDVSLNDVLSILDEKTHASRFDRHLLQATLESLNVGVHVVDGQQRLIAWNSPYLDMFAYPDGMIRVGRPIEELIRYNATTGFLGPGEADALVSERLAYMRSGQASVFERETSDGRVIRIAGQPMPGGGYVTVLTDVTQDRRRERALAEANETLERRVRERTAELEKMAGDLDLARREAEGANASKTRFLAAASHDLMQPLNAARLFVGALAAPDAMACEERRHLAAKADRAVESANQLLTGLLDISRLDHGGREPRMRRLPLGPLMEDLADEARPMAEAAGLSLRVVVTSLTVWADVDFLQSILRNFLSNARRYTRRGGILIGARRVGDRVRVEVWDTGPGVPEEAREAVFDEFRRLEETDNAGVRGAGLGLAVARRMASMMGASLSLRSRVGKGSVFGVLLERADTVVPVAGRNPVTDPASRADPDTLLCGRRILCVDDEAGILDAMRVLVAQWGGEALTARTGAEAVSVSRQGRIDAVIVDYQLADGETGFDVLTTLSRVMPRLPPAALITANRSETIRQRAQDRGLRLIFKPVAPQQVREFLGLAVGGAVR